MIAFFQQSTFLLQNISCLKKELYTIEKKKNRLTQ